MVAVGVGAWSVEAAQNGSNKPLTLYDANGIFLGDLVDAGINDSADSNYSSYLPSVGGVLIFQNDGYGDIVPIGLGPTSFQIWYPGTDCSGQAYMGLNPSANANAIDSNFIWLNHGSAVRIATSSTQVDVQSVGGNSGGGCTNQSGNPGTRYFAVLPVTLPFDLSSVIGPFKIVAP